MSKKKYKLKDKLEILFKMIYKCQLCNYQTPVKCNYQKHLKTKKHQTIKSGEHSKNVQNDPKNEQNEQKSFFKKGSKKYIF